MLRCKLVHLKKIYKFDFDHFLIKRTVFVLIEKTLLKIIKNCSFRPNNARYEKMSKNKIVHLKKIYKIDSDHFLVKRTVFILFVKNLIKIQNFNFPVKLLRYTKNY